MAGTEPPPLEDGRRRIDELRRRLAASRAEVEERLGLERRMSTLFMTGRLITFGAVVGCLIATKALRVAAIGWAGTLPAAAGFVALVLLHQPVKRRIARLLRILDLIDRKASRLDDEARPPVTDDGLRDAAARRLVGGEEGRAFRLPRYTLEDLAVFDGRAHLFGLVDSTVTRLGALRVADWLCSSSRDPSVIAERQAAARELLDAPALREKIEQELAACPAALSDESIEFARSGSVGLGEPSRLSWLWPTTACTGLLLAASLVFSSGLLAVAAVLVATAGNHILRDAQGRCTGLRQRFAAFRLIFRSIAAIDEHLEHADPQSPLLRELHRRLRAITGPPAATIPGMLRSMTALELHRAGLIYVVVNWLTLWDLHFLRPLTTRWEAARDQLLAGLDATGRLEALVSFANLAEEQIGYVWPEVVDGDEPRLEIDRGAHPLLSSSVVVHNSVELEAERGVLIISGSNMSGKSTFLKMCGLDLLLAQAGAPVRAAGMRWTPLKLYSDINIRDSLDDGRSYFAVEVGRIKTVLDEAADDPRQLALLDEIFRGTNTHEKVAGGIEVARWLAARRTLVLLATHDHELTELEGAEPGLGIRNYHFSETIEGDTMVFSYRLQEGPAASCNALRLLAIEGYPDELVSSAMKRAENDE